MLDWLMLKGIAHDLNMQKAELFEIIAKNFSKSVVCKIGNLLRNKEHEILRLPPYHCYFNAVEYVWSSAKHYIKYNNITEDLSLGNLQSLLDMAFSKVILSE